MKIDPSAAEARKMFSGRDDSRIAKALRIGAAEFSAENRIGPERAGSDETFRFGIGEIEHGSEIQIEPMPPKKTSAFFPEIPGQILAARESDGESRGQRRKKGNPRDRTALLIDGEKRRDLANTGGPAEIRRKATNVSGVLEIPAKQNEAAGFLSRDEILEIRIQMILRKTDQKKLPHLFTEGHFFDLGIDIRPSQSRSEGENNQRKKEASWCHSRVQDNIQWEGPPRPSEGENKK